MVPTRSRTESTLLCRTGTPLPHAFVAAPWAAKFGVQIPDRSPVLHYVIQSPKNNGHGLLDARHVSQEEVIVQVELAEIRNEQLTVQLSSVALSQQAHTLLRDPEALSTEYN